MRGGAGRLIRTFRCTCKVCRSCVAFGVEVCDVFGIGHCTIGGTKGCTACLIDPRDGGLCNRLCNVLCNSCVKCV